ncbi:hypothetical protein [Peribacillus muralis]|nr:hypothetical protein [Peribacillus muralis]
MAAAMTAIPIHPPAALHAAPARLKLKRLMWVVDELFKGVTSDMDENEIRIFRPVFVYANLEKKKRLVRGVTEDRDRLIIELKNYSNALSPFLINVLKSNIDQWNIEIYDWQEEINKIEEVRSGSNHSLFVDDE